MRPRRTTLKKRLAEAKEILEAVGMPLSGGSSRARRADRLALALMAAANLTLETDWSNASIDVDDGWRGLTTRETIAFWNKHFGEKLKPGSYDDVWREDYKRLYHAGLVRRAAGKPDAPINDGTRRYAIDPAAADVLRLFGSPRWADAVSRFLANNASLKEKFNRRREENKIPVRLPDGRPLTLAPGAHNELQKAIVEEFLPKFARGCQVLYMSDADRKRQLVDDIALSDLGFPKFDHKNLPDVVAYDPGRNWIFLIEAVHSANPISQLRHLDLEELTKACRAPRIYVSAFSTRTSFRKWVADISWETEVWIADESDHLIHFDGEKFLGPYPGSD